MIDIRDMQHLAAQSTSNIHERVLYFTLQMNMYNILLDTYLFNRIFRI